MKDGGCLADTAGSGKALGGTGRTAWRTRVTEVLGIERPIVQGGLAHLAFSELCIAVSEAGGLGQITATSTGSPKALREEIHRVRDGTDRPFGVNFAIGHIPIEPYLDVALEEDVPVLSVTGGNPQSAFERSQGSHARRVVLVAGVRAARKAESLGADAVIAVGVEGGGHLGRDDLGLVTLVPRVADAVSIPVLASGGIVDGYGLTAALALGAEGIEMGTRFVATRECRAHEAYKRAIVAGSELDTRIIERTVGRPGRVLPSRFVDEILAKEADGVDLTDLLPWIEGSRNRVAALEGQLDEGFVWAGQGIGGIHDVPTVRELLDRMDGEARTALARLRSSGIQA